MGRLRGQPLPPRVGARRPHGKLFDLIANAESCPDFLGCRATLAMTGQVYSPLLQKAIDMRLPETARTMVSAFEEWAWEVVDR